MMVLDDLKDHIPLREISRISGISLSGYYYRPSKRHIQRLDPSTKKRIKEIASERPTYGYRRVWAMLRNQGTKVNQKIVRKVLKEYSQYSLNLKNWLYEDLTSIMGQSPPGWFFELVYKDAHSPLIYWMKDKPGIKAESDSDESENHDETLEDLISDFSLKRDGPLIRIGSPISSAQLLDLKARMRNLNYEFLEQKGVFRPKWNGVKK